MRSTIKKLRDIASELETKFADEILGEDRLAIGPQGQVAFPFLADLQALADAKYPDGFMYPEGVTERAFGERVDIPKALVTDAVLDWIDATPEQKEQIKRNISVTRFLPGVAYGKPRVCPVAWQFVDRGFGFLVQGPLLDGVWTVREGVSIKDIEAEIREWAKSRYRLG